MKSYFFLRKQKNKKKKQQQAMKIFKTVVCYRRDLRLTHFILETPKGVLAKSADPDQMPHNVASDLGLHYFASCSTIFQQKCLN